VKVDSEKRKLLTAFVHAPPTLPYTYTSAVEQPAVQRVRSRSPTTYNSPAPTSPGSLMVSPGSSLSFAVTPKTPQRDWSPVRNSTYNTVALPVPLRHESQISDAPSASSNLVYQGEHISCGKVRFSSDIEGKGTAEFVDWAKH